VKKALWIPLIAICIGCGGTGTKVADSTSQVGTLAGSSTPGAIDGPLAVARFRNPVNVLAAPDSSIFVADFNNDRVRRIGNDGIVSTVIQDPNFSRPFGLARSPAGVLFVQTDANSAGVRDGTSGTIWTLNGVTLTVLAENIGRPRGMVWHPTGQLVVADLTNHQLRLINPTTGASTFLAGGITAGFANGVGAAARFSRPYGMVVLPDQSILVADANNQRIRRVLLDGTVTTFAGTGVQGSTNGFTTDATFNTPQALALGADGSVYVADTGGSRVRKIKDGFVTTVVGSGVKGFLDGDRSVSQFFGLEGISMMPDGSLVIADGTGGDDAAPHHRVRRATLP
jgi:streptogramin lyase